MSENVKTARRIAGWLLVAAVVAFLWSAYQVSQIDKEMSATLRAHQALQEDATSGGTLLKSFFDGLTLGATGGGDAFAEYHRLTSTDSALRERFEELESARGSAAGWRGMSVIAGICAGVFLGVTNERKKE